MKSLAVAVLAVSFATAVTAQLTPGTVIKSGEPFPVVADFNGDGLDDLVQEKSVLINDGAAFTTEVKPIKLRMLERIVGVADVNGDHIPDLITMTTSAGVPPSVDPTGGARTGPLYRLYIGDSSRNYGPSIDIITGPQPYVADVDGDGKDDFLLLNDIRPDTFRTVYTEVTILRSRGDGTFEVLPAFRIPPEAQIYPDYRVPAGDIDHDGITDLVIRCVNDLVVLHGEGGGRFTVESRYLPMSLEYGWWSTRLADIDGDSNLDVVIPIQRGVRVFFGDGHGNFPRMSKAPIAKEHDAVGLPFMLPITPDQLNQPRDLAVGHFTRNDRSQIAGGTGEGDIALIGYEDGSLHEILRTRTEFWAPTVRPGTFRTPGHADVYAMGTYIWGDIYPRPRLFYAENKSAEPVSTTPRTGRTRAVRPSAPANGVTTTYRMQISGDCISEPTNRWAFSRDGIFGRAQGGETTIDAVFDGSLIYFRVTAPYAKQPAVGILTEANGLYSGTAEVVTTSCGVKTLTVTATPE